MTEAELRELLAEYLTLLQRHTSAEEFMGAILTDNFETGFAHGDQSLAQRSPHVSPSRMIGTVRPVSFPKGLQLAVRRSFGREAASRAGSCGYAP